MTAPLTGWYLAATVAALAAFTYLRSFLAARGIILPGPTKSWIEIIGGENLYNCYLTAKAQMEEPDSLITVTEAIIQALAQSIAGKTMPDRVALGIASVLDVIFNHGGLAALKEFAARF